MKALPLIIALILPLSGCMQDYYTAQLALYQMQREEREQARAAELVASSIPIVNFTFVDSGGQQQTLVVNQQRSSNTRNQVPVAQLKTPLDQLYPWFDRTLSVGASFIPFFAGSREKRGNTYSFGDGASFYQTNGENSPLSYDWKTSWEATTTTGE